MRFPALKAGLPENAISFHTHLAINRLSSLLLLLFTIERQRLKLSPFPHRLEKIYEFERYLLT